MSKKTLVQKGARIVTEHATKDVNFMVDAEIDFVSLVRHAANQMPFRIIKEECKGGESMRTVVQSIMLPKGVSLADIATGELQWLVEAKTDKTEDRDSYVRYEQKPLADFQKSSLSMVKLHSNGTYALVGELVKKDELAKGEFLALGSREVKKLMALDPSALDSPLASGPQMPPYMLSFREMFEKELMSFLDVVQGSLSQSGATPEVQKQTVMGALDSLRTFLGIALDEVAASEPAGAQKGQKNGEMLFMMKELEKLKETLNGAFKSEKEGGIEDMFKTKEEFASAVMDVIKAHDAEKEAKAKEDADLAAKQAEETAKAEAEKKSADEAAAKAAGGNPDIAALVAQIATLGQSVATLTEKTDKMGAQLVSSPGSLEGDDPPQNTEKAKKSVFAGLLTVAPEE
jgi:hypothetical protein